MTRKFFFLIATLAALSATAVAEPPASPADPDAAQVSVYARRAKLRVLHAQLIKLEGQIYADYNKVNTEHRYDIVCDTYVETGSRFSNRRCLPAFAHTATQEEASGFMSQYHLDGHPADSASMVVLREGQEFRKHYRKVIASHPQLLELDRQHAELKKNYEALQRETFKGKLIDWN